MNEVSFSSGARIWGGGCFQLLFHDPAHNQDKAPGKGVQSETEIAD